MGDEALTLIDLIKLHEGLRLKPYQCTAGKLSIGYGRNLDDMGITEDEAEALLHNDIARVRRELAALDIGSGLDDVRAAVVVDMCFNLGINRLLRFRNFLSALRAKDFERAAREMVDSRWYRQVGTRAERLVEMMKTGEWPR